MPSKSKHSKQHESKDSYIVKDILNNFREGEVGDFIRKDKTVQLIVYNHYYQKSRSKARLKKLKGKL